MMPKTVTLIRHGESESNRAQKLAEEGLAHENEAALMSVHTSERRLTPRGIEQAQATGAFIRAWMHRWSISVGECRFYVSPYAGLRRAQAPQGARVLLASFRRRDYAGRVQSLS